MCLVAHHVGRPKTCSLFTLFTKKKGQWCMTRSAIRLLQGNALSEFPLSFSSVRLLVLWVVGVTDGFQALHSAQVKVCYRSPCQVRVCHIGSVELNAIEVSVAKVGLREVSFAEVGMIETSTTEVSVAEISPAEIVLIEIGVDEVSSAE